jgi:hypothetical protein
LVHLNVTLTPAEWLSAWRAESKRLVLSVPTAPRSREVAVRVELAGRRVHAVLVGTAVSTHAHGTRHRLEIVPDPESARAMRLLDASARGEPVRFVERADRVTAKVPVTVVGDAGEVYMTTLNLSEGGCQLRWSGPPPAVGQVLHLRFRTKAGKVDVRGVLCWHASAGSRSAAGVRFGPDARVALRALLPDTARA